MKQVIFSLIVLLGIAPAAQAGQDSRPHDNGLLTLEQACGIALENNPGIEQAMQRIEAATAVLAQARTAWKPTVSAKGAVQGIDATAQPDWQPTMRVSDAYAEWSAGIGLTWLIFDGFAREATILASSYAVEASEQTLANTRRLLLKAVSTAFLQAQLTMENMAIARQNQQFNRTLEEDARKRWTIGTSPESEMLNFAVKALKAESDFRNAERDFTVTCSALTELMGMEQAELSPERTPVPSLSDGQPENAPSWDTEYAYALNHRPDLMALGANVNALEQTRRAEKGSYQPKLVFFSGYDYQYISGRGSVNEEEHQTYAGISATWDLYTGGRTKARLNEISANIRAVEQQQQQTLLSIQSSIRSNLETAAAAWENFKRQQEIRDLTLRIRTHVEKSYRAGVATLTRLNEAQTDLVQASGAVAASYIQYRLALVNLDAETGRISR